MYSNEHYQQADFLVPSGRIASLSELAEPELFLRFGEVRKICLDRDQGMARLRRSGEELKVVDALVERLRDFIRLNYLTAAEVARQIGVREATIYDWLLRRTRPRNLSASARFWILYRERKDPALFQSDTSTVNTRTGAGFRSRAVVLSVSGRKATFEGAVAGF